VAFDHSLALDPNNAGIWFHKGKALYNLEQYQEAVVAFDRALALDPNNAEAWQDKADALRGIGLEKDARKAEKQAKKLNR
jgi:Flp pilus assembly protein TadD